MRINRSEEPTATSTARTTFMWLATNKVILHCIFNIWRTFQITILASWGGIRRGHWGSGCGGGCGPSCCGRCWSWVWIWPNPNTLLLTWVGGAGICNSWRLIFTFWHIFHICSGRNETIIGTNTPTIVGVGSQEVVGAVALVQSLSIVHTALFSHNNPFHPLWHTHWSVIQTPPDDEHNTGPMHSRNTTGILLNWQKVNMTSFWVSDWTHL